VVDDQLFVSLAVGLMLKGAGYEFTTASNGRQALELILGAIEDKGQMPFDMVLTDIDMPVMSGVELLAELEKRGITIPVVVMTGNADDYRDLIATSDRVGFLEKPFSSNKLIDEVKNILSKHRLAVPEK
jgi:CheY-like chemotaxis protein